MPRQRTKSPRRIQIVVSELGGHEPSRNRSMRLIPEEGDTADTIFAAIRQHILNQSEKKRDDIDDNAGI